MLYRRDCHSSIFFYWRTSRFLKKYKMVDFSIWSDRIMFDNELFAGEQFEDEQSDAAVVLLLFCENNKDRK